MDQLTCPYCGKIVEITQAIKHQIEEQTLVEIHTKHKKELEELRKTTLYESSKKIKEQFELQMKRVQEDGLEKDERIRQLIEQITELTKELRLSKKEKDEARLEMEKKLTEEEGKIRREAQKKAEDEQHLKLLAKDKQLADTLKELEDARRKLQQGSQQNQGEVFELQFEQILKNEFPNDKVEEVTKGTKGGDITQEVWDRNGNLCGKILWELKNTKSWSEQWVDKVKNDQRLVTADYSVIISEAVPQDIDCAKYYKGIWVTKKSFVVALAYSLRLNLIQVAMAKRAQEGKREKMDILYSYLTGTEFRLRLEAIVEAFTNMQQEIEKEKRYFSNKWARDEKYIRQVIDNTLGMHGDLKGIIGKAVPQITSLDILELDSG